MIEDSVKRHDLHTLCETVKETNGNYNASLSTVRGTRCRKKV